MMDTPWIVLVLRNMYLSASWMINSHVRHERSALISHLRARVHRHRPPLIHVCSTCSAPNHRTGLTLIMSNSPPGHSPPAQRATGHASWSSPR
jgi:hypothetical protein